jgi:uncharacterized RDD family membrane protein YckC
MTCSYCGSRNDELENRCRRCGRKPGDTLNGGIALHLTSGALATKIRPTIMADAPPIRIPDMGAATQGSLFTPNVIAMPNRMAPRSPRTRTAAPATSTGARTTTRKSSRTAPKEQGEFEFVAPAPPKTKTLGTTVDAVIYCEAPVATAIHRALAASIDLTMILVAYGLFLLTFVLCGGEIVVNRPNLIVLASAFALIAGTYGVFWTVAGADSVGMRWTHLRLITFDCFTPDRWQRAARLAGMALSLFSVLGVLWSLADEESLGWQDHISGTFPTAHELESRVFRRR